MHRERPAFNAGKWKKGKPAFNAGEKTYEKGKRRLSDGTMNEKEARG